MKVDSIKYTLSHKGEQWTVFYSACAVAARYDVVVTTPEGKEIEWRSRSGTPSQVDAAKLASSYRKAMNGEKK